MLELKILSDPSPKRKIENTPLNIGVPDKKINKNRNK